MRMATVSAVLFDLDGTLIDTNEIIIESYQHTFKTHFPDITIDRDTIIAAIGPPLMDTFARYTDSDALINAAVETYRTYYTANEHHHYALYPHVITTLKRLKEHGIKMAIVTSKFKGAAWPSIKRFGLDSLFDAFVSLNDVTRPKPDKEPVVKALTLLGVGKDALMIGDNDSDILAGQAAGVKTAGVAWSIKGRAHLEAVSPDYILADMTDLISLLGLPRR